MVEFIPKSVESEGLWVQTFFLQLSVINTLFWSLKWWLTPYKAAQLDLWWEEWCGEPSWGPVQRSFSGSWATQSNEPGESLQKHKTGTSVIWKENLDGHWQKHPGERVTWQRKEGENAQRDHAQLSECVLHADDVHQDLLWHVRSPEQHEAELTNKSTKDEIIPLHPSLQPATS